MIAQPKKSSSEFLDRSCIYGMNKTEHFNLWVKSEAKHYLRLMNYDPDSEISIHEQFMDRWKEEMEKTKTKKRKKKNLTQ